MMGSDVGEWLERSLEAYYPILFIDCVFIKVHRKRSCASEAFYVILGVKEDKTREVIGIYNRPNESAEGWAEMLTAIKERGAENVGLIVADGLSGLDTAVSAVYPEAGLQRCTTHLKRNMMNRVRHGDKLEMANDLRKDFRRVTRMRGALPSEESVLLLMGKTAMDKEAYDRALPWMELDKSLFPGE